MNDTQPKILSEKLDETVEKKLDTIIAAHRGVLENGQLQLAFFEPGADRNMKSKKGWFSMGQGQGDAHPSAWEVWRINIVLTEIGAPNQGTGGKSVFSQQQEETTRATMELIQARIMR